jgi:hypothetical protein
MRPAEYLQSADAAVVGRLVDVIPRGQLRADYLYRVKRVYRGDGLKRGGLLTVRSGRGGAGCALPRRKKRTYGLFLARDGLRWTSGICAVINPRRLWAVSRRQGGSDSGTASGINCAS